MSDRLARLDGVGQAALVREGSVSAEEIVEAAIRRSEQVDAQLNLVVTPLYGEARRAARAALPDGPLAGAPMLLKDFLATFAGARHTAGSRFLRSHVAKADSELVARYKGAGLIVIGIANLPEFAILSTTESELHGPSRNPWDPTRSTGGSSGAGAAAVAAGVVPIAHGNDVGGSLRIPASCCGVFGMKPTRARNPLGPYHGDLGTGLWAEHVMTRSVRDNATALDVTAGSQAGDPYSAPERPAGGFLAALNARPRSLRIAVSEHTLGGTEVHPDCRRAVADAAALCAELGHAVVDAAPEIDGPQLESDFFAVFSNGVAAMVADWGERLEIAPSPDDFERLTWAVSELGKKGTAVAHLLAVQRMQRTSRQVGEFFEQHDMLLTPTLGEPPPPLGYFDAPPDNPLAVLDMDAKFSPFTWLANVTGQPAMSVPLMWNEEGMPIGVHFMGRFGDEATLLQLAAQLEEARPWSLRTPPVNAYEHEEAAQ